MKLKELIKKPLLLIVIMVVAISSLLLIFTPWDSSRVAAGEGENLEEASDDHVGCSSITMPLEVEVAVQNVIENQGGAQENGGLAEVQLSVKPLLDTNELSWHLELPEGVTVFSGPGSWKGAVAKDQAASFVMTLSVPDGKEYYINAVSQFVSTEGVRARRGRLLKVDLGEPEPPANPFFVREDEQGRRIKTFRGKVTGGGQ